jgi:hypothetical protein
MLPSGLCQSDRALNGDDIVLNISRLKILF